jgi:hypothetical protein
MRQLVFFLFFCFACASVAAPSQATPALTGTWSGMLAFPGEPLLFVIAFSGDDKSFSATASSPYQGAGPTPVDSLLLSGGKLTFAIPKLGVTYTGTIGENTISGTFTQRGSSLPMKLTPSSIGTKDLAGTWLGTLTLSGGKLLLALHVQDAANGALSATLDSPYQHGFDIPVSSIDSKDGTLTFSLANLNASYTGKIGEAGIAGTFSQNGMTLPLTLMRP